MSYNLKQTQGESETEGPNVLQSVGLPGVSQGLATEQPTNGCYLIFDRFAKAIQ